MKNAPKGSKRVDVSLPPAEKPTLANFIVDKKPAHPRPTVTAPREE